MKFDKILLLAQNALGDVILTTGFAKAVRETFPGSRLAFLCAPFAADLCRLPFIDDMVVYTKGMPMLPVIRRLWRFDVAMCLDFKYRSAVIPFFARIPVRAGIAHKRKLFMTHAVDRNPDHEKMYFAEHLADIMRRAIGLELKGDLSHLYVADATPQDKAAVDEALRDFPADGLRVAIAPFSSTTMKDWAVDRYEAFMATLTQKYQARFFIIGGPEEAGRGFPVPENALDLRGKLRITETAELLRRADCFVGSCSAPLHVATAVGLPCLAFYGPGSPAKWAPRHKCITLQHPQPCTPCDAVGYGNPCGFDNVCMRLITLDETIDAFGRLLRENPPPSR
ncbi:MAG: glycosyltransferase family 9 protein [Schwartzia sp.]|nr:glycosyltransferase family 9 protein [Schwartzia sp. (in: firmicutes)]